MAARATMLLMVAIAVMATVANAATYPAPMQTMAVTGTSSAKSAPILVGMENGPMGQMVFALDNMGIVGQKANATLMSSTMAMWRYNVTGTNRQLIWLTNTSFALVCDKTIMAFCCCGKSLWNFTANGTIVKTSSDSSAPAPVPQLWGGKLFFGTSMPTSGGGSFMDSMVYAVDINNGSMVWMSTNTTKGRCNYRVTLCADHMMLMVPSKTSSGAWWLNAYCMKTGMRMWQTKSTRQNSQSTVSQYAVAEVGTTVLAVGSNYGLFYNATTGARISGIAPDFTASTTASSQVEVMALNNTFFVFTGYGGGKVGFYTVTGTAARTAFTTTYSFRGMPAYCSKEKMFYLGTSNGTYYKMNSAMLKWWFSPESTNQAVGVTFVNSMFAVAATTRRLFLVCRMHTGMIVWGTASTSATQTQTTAVIKMTKTGYTVFAGGYYSYNTISAFAINSGTGASSGGASFIVKNPGSNSGEFDMTPMINGTMVFACLSDTGYCMAINRMTGATVWKKKVASSITEAAGIILAGGNMFVSSSSMMYCVTQKMGANVGTGSVALKTSSSPKMMAVTANALFVTQSYYLNVIDTNDCTKMYNTKPSSSGSGVTFSRTLTAPTVGYGRGYMAGYDKLYGYKGIKQAVPKPSFTKKAKTTGSSSTSSGATYVTPFLYGGKVVAADDEGNTYAFGRETGLSAWLLGSSSNKKVFGTGMNIYSVMAFANRVYSFTSNAVVCYSISNGKMLWSLWTGDLSRSWNTKPMITPDGTIIALSYSGYTIRGINGMTGKALYNATFDNIGSSIRYSAKFTPTFVNGVIWTTASYTIYGHNAYTGAQLAQIRSSTRLYTPAVGAPDNKTIYYGDGYTFNSAETGDTATWVTARPAADNTPSDGGKDTTKKSAAIVIIIVIIVVILVVVAIGAVVAKMGGGGGSGQQDGGSGYVQMDGRQERGGGNV